MPNGVDAFRLQFEISPIILVGGIASGTPGGMLPVINLMSGLDQSGFQSSGNSTDYNSYAHFEPLAGSTLEEFEIGTYPFANQYVAANAVIFEPLKLSLLMIAPAPANGGYTNKINAFTNVKSSLDQHISQGGYFNVATPAYLYTGALLVTLRDITPPDSRQKQWSWQWDFLLPLISQQSADQAQNVLTQKMTSGVQVSGDPPSQGGAETTTGIVNPGTSANLTPAAGNLGAQVGPVGSSPPTILT